MLMNLGRKRWLGGILALVAGLTLGGDLAQGQVGGAKGKDSKTEPALKPAFDPLFSGKPKAANGKVVAGPGKRPGAAPAGGQIGGQGGVILPPGGGVVAGMPEDNRYPEPAKGVVDKARQVKKAVRKDLLAKPGVIGLGLGLDEDGVVFIKVLLDGLDQPQLPQSVDGVKVKGVVVGEVRPRQYLPRPPANVARQRRLPRPVQIGVSAFPHTTDLCAAGTLGCRLRTKSGRYYALSNNHVFGLENEAEIGKTKIVQPSPLDESNYTLDECPGPLISTNVLGLVVGFAELTFDEANPNLIDAAVISTDVSLTGVSTLPDGYGVPRSTTVDAFLGQRVQKYGRTTGYRIGVVTGIELDIGPVGYEAGDAYFTETIEVVGIPEEEPFSAAGDSGSLVVDMNRNPVGLLFAGGGFPIDYTYCNDIDNVLAYFRLTLGDRTLMIDDSTPTIPPGKVGNSSPLVPVSPLLPVVP